MEIIIFIILAVLGLISLTFIMQYQNKIIKERAEIISKNMDKEGYCSVQINDVPYSVRSCLKR